MTPDGPYGRANWGECGTGRRRFDSTRPGDVTYARRQCRACAIRASCMAWAIGRADLAGTWAATTAEERVVLRKVLSSRHG